MALNNMGSMEARSRVADSGNHSVEISEGLEWWRMGNLMSGLSVKVVIL